MDGLIVMMLLVLLFIIDYVSRVLFLILVFDVVMFRNCELIGRFFDIIIVKRFLLKIGELLLIFRIVILIDMVFVRGGVFLLEVCISRV